jgi:hypothetical protein
MATGMWTAERTGANCSSIAVSEELLDAVSALTVTANLKTEPALDIASSPIVVRLDDSGASGLLGWPPAVRPLPFAASSPFHSKNHDVMNVRGKDTLKTIEVLVAFRDGEDRCRHG